MGYISEKYGIEKGTVVKLIKDGLLDWRVEGLYDFWIFYNDLIENRETKKEVREELMAHYGINTRRTYYYWLEKARNIFC